jgi:hypothetical protein
VRTHFRPVNRVLSEIQPEVTRKVGTTADDTDIMDGFPRCRPPRRTPYNWTQDWVHRAIARLFFVIGVIRLIRVKLFLLFFAEFLESGIATQRVPDWIEPKKGRRNRRCKVIIPAPIGRLQQLGES